MPNHMTIDPFVNHPPCWTDAAHLILNALEKAENEMIRHAQHDGVPNNNSYHTRREMGSSELNNLRNAKRPNHYYIFCTHEVPYWRTCTKCGRDKNLAKRNADMVLKHIGGAAFFTK